MCGKLFSQEEDLKHHYDHHVESWTSCPVCLCSLKNFKVKGFLDLYQHIVRGHVRHSSTSQVILSFFLYNVFSKGLV